MFSLTGPPNQLSLHPLALLVHQPIPNILGTERKGQDKRSGPRRHVCHSSCSCPTLQTKVSNWTSQGWRQRVLIATPVSAPLVTHCMITTGHYANCELGWLTVQVQTGLLWSKPIEFNRTYSHAREYRIMFWDASSILGCGCNPTQH